MKLLFLLISSVLLLNACRNYTSNDGDHDLIYGVMIYKYSTNDSTLLASTLKDSVKGSLNLNKNDSLLCKVFFTDPDLAINYEIFEEASHTLEFNQNTDSYIRIYKNSEGKFNFTIQAKEKGQTELRFKLKHFSHDDFVSAKVIVDVL